VPDPSSPTLEWIVLTMGDRNEALESAVRSTAADPVAVVWNGAGPDPLDSGSRTLVAAENLGVPGGRDLGARTSVAEVVGFLDDDAALGEGAGARIREAFAGDDRLGAVALRLIDEEGRTARRHVPRLGSDRPEESGDVALFLGGACAIRRAAYADVGGYFTELFYGHEELELSWRLIDRGWRIRYLADVDVFHPHSDIERHADGWRLTGRNRVLVGRRTLPWPVAVLHVTIWLLAGLMRAPSAEHRRAYLGGWRAGWRIAVDRRPIRWATVWRLTRLGRPPIV
jgi:hypothetical protein